jgi:hypothetical protein
LCTSDKTDHALAIRACQVFDHKRRAFALTVTRFLGFRALHREACAFEAPTKWRRADKKPVHRFTGAF